MPTATAKKAKKEVVRIQMLEEVCIDVRIKAYPGSPLVVNNLRSKHGVDYLHRRMRGKKITSKGTVRDPFQEYVEAMYITPGGAHALPTNGIKLAVCSALQFLPDIELTQARAKRIIGVNRGMELTPIHWDPTPNKSPLMFVPQLPKDSEIKEPEPFYMTEIPDDYPDMREDIVRLQGQTKAPDLRYRPQYKDWYCDLKIHFPPAIITMDSVVNLVAIAGRYIGLCEWRPDKGGDWGMFEVETNIEDKPKKSRPRSKS